MRRRIAEWLGARDLRGLGPALVLPLALGGMYGASLLGRWGKARFPGSSLVEIGGALLLIVAAAAGLMLGMWLGMRVSRWAGSLVYEEFIRLYAPFRERARDRPPSA